MNIYFFEIWNSGLGKEIVKLINKDFFVCVCKISKQKKSNPKLLFKDKIKKYINSLLREMTVYIS